MAAVRVLILRAPGTNCDHETAHAFSLAGGAPERLHLNRVLEAPDSLKAFQILCVPGGFSYGDDLAAGRVLAARMRRELGDPLREFRDRGGLILGICNGFQALLQTGLLIEPGADGQKRATLALNTSGRFIDRWVHLRLTPGVCKFLDREETITLPIAHGEGNFIAREEGLLGELESEGRISVRYAAAPGESKVDNPNGSMGDVAGICDATGQVFALMPHPERHLSPYQHPTWTRRQAQPAEGDGLRIFKTAVARFR